MTYGLRHFLHAICVACFALSCGSGLGAAEDKSGAAFRDQVKPFLAKYCIDCHGGAEPEAKLALDTFADPAAISNHREVWTKVRKYLQSRIMPPKDADQPTVAESRTVIHWIDTHFSGVDCDLKRDPGRVTIRRLNRTEYNNTIRDLLGVDFR